MPKPVQFAVAVLFASAAFAQNPTGQSATQVFAFSYAQTQVDFQQITNAVRSIGEITQAYLNTDSKTLTVTGTAAQVAMASWMVTTMDQPAPANSATQEYRPVGSVNDVVRLLYLTHPQTPSSFQDVINSVRIIPEMLRVFPYSAQNAIVMRGTDNQATMAEWLFHQLDAPAGVQPVQNPAAHQYASQAAANDIVQVLFLANPWSPQSLQQMTNTLRVIPQLTKVFQCGVTGALAVRGPTATVALATWIFSQLDQAPPAPTLSPQEFQMPGGADDVTQILRLAPATTAASFQSIVAAIRGTVKLPVFPDEIWNAVTLRGTAAQVASADALIKQMNQR